MSPCNQDHVVESYRQSFKTHGNTAEAVQWSEEGQQWRFDKLIQITSPEPSVTLEGKTILEIGCGLGHFYPKLLSIMPGLDYTGIDIVPEMIEHAQKAHPAARFECRDIFKHPYDREFDFVFISGVFNAPARNDNEGFMTALLEHAFAACRTGLAFNFTSSHVNFRSEGMNYFDPAWVLNESIKNLSRKVSLHHHYRNCDVAVYVYR